MTMQEALQSRLAASASILAIVADPQESSSISWVERPQLSALPAITLTSLSSPLEEHMKGLQSLQFIRVQIDCWALSHVEAQQLSEAVIATVVQPNVHEGIYFRKASIQSLRDLGEKASTEFVHRKQLDLIVRFSPV